MTREEEIKARLVCKIACYCDAKKGKEHDFYLALPADQMDGIAANSDLHYLLARNEELQRQVIGHRFISEQRANDVQKLQQRVEFLEDVLSYIKDESPEMRHQVLEYEDKVRQDAKEQDDAKL